MVNNRHYAFKNRLFQICIIVKRTCISIFRKIGLVDQSNPCAQFFFAKNASCTNLQLPVVILQKSIISDMNHRITYMYINLQPNWFNRSVKTVHTNIFTIFRMLHKFADTNSNLKKEMYARRTRSFFRNKNVIYNSARINKSDFTTEKIV